MRLLLINEVCGTGSTGKITADIAERYKQNGYEVKIAYGRNGFVPENCKEYAVRIGSDADVRLHALYTRLTDRHGLASCRATKRFLRWADEYDPDELWIHNIHGYFINYKLLFEWIKSRPQMKVVWTLHDCWAFTGHCSHYMFSKCEKWKTGCHDCPEKRSYPGSVLIDNSRVNYQIKKASFSGVKDMKLICPSKWLASQTRESFLKEYPVEVINNKIDTESFRPAESSFKANYNIENKKIVLGVANRWTDRKGLSDFVTLASMLKDEYKIVLVGLSEKQIKALPSSMIGITRTESKKELAGLYSAASVFLNLTYEENYPTVNLEAEACGTDVITYDAGGSRETIHREGSAAVAVGDIKKVLELVETK